VTPGQDYKNLSEKKAPDVGLIVDNEGESVYYNESAGLTTHKQPGKQNQLRPIRGELYQAFPDCFKSNPTPIYGVF